MLPGTDGGVKKNKGLFKNSLNIFVTNFGMNPNKNISAISK
jgi:hypothetical protein